MNNKKSNNNQLLMTLLKGRTFIVLVLLVIFYHCKRNHIPVSIYTDHGFQARSPVWNPCTWYDLRNHYRRY